MVLPPGLSLTAHRHRARPRRLGAALANLVSNLLYGVSATDPMTFIVIPVILLAVAALAIYIPARRASRVDPVVALNRMTLDGIAQCFSRDRGELSCLREDSQLHVRPRDLVDALQERRDPQVGNARVALCGSRPARDTPRSSSLRGLS